MLDRRDFSPIKYQRINKKTGKEVPWDQIVKGYEYQKGEYLLLVMRNCAAPMSRQLNP